MYLSYSDSLYLDFYLFLIHRKNLNIIQVHEVVYLFLRLCKSIASFAFYFYIILLHDFSNK